MPNNPRHQNHFKHRADHLRAKRRNRKHMWVRQTHLTTAAAALLVSLATTATADFHNRKKVKALQEILSQCGFDPGAIDGNWGTNTARATADYIRAHGGHPESGIEVLMLNQAQYYIISVGGPCPKNSRRQDTPVPKLGRQAQVGQILEIQKMLIKCGFDPGPADGVWGTKTAKAATAYIRAHGGNAEGLNHRHSNDPELRDALITRTDSYRTKGSQACPAPGAEIWDCSTFFETSGIILTADHDAKMGMVTMGSLPTIETNFLVEGLDRVWMWHNSSGEQYQFLIGPSTLGLQGYYFHFPASTKEGEKVESKASYSCEQTRG